MNWMNKQVSLYTSHRDNTGRPASYRQVLFSEFGNDFPVIYSLRQLQRDYEVQKISDMDYKIKKSDLKSKLRCFSPAALLESRAKGNVIEKSRTGMMQLDFDSEGISDFDIEELKQAICYSLPFVAYCGLSCSGTGFYALISIAEPERLSEYAERCFQVFKNEYGIEVDTSKGRNPQDLRYISYDANPYWRENPEPLKIPHFRRKAQPKSYYKPNGRPINKKGNDAIVDHLLTQIRRAQVGQRFATVQKIAFTAGGLLKPEILPEIKSAIALNHAFVGEERKYLKVAEDCFRAGSQKPLIK